MGQPSPQERQRMSPFAVILTAVLSLALSGALLYLGIRLLQAAFS